MLYPASLSKLLVRLFALVIQVSVANAISISLSLRICMKSRVLFCNDCGFQSTHLTRVGGASFLLYRSLWFLAASFEQPSKMRSLGQKQDDLYAHVCLIRSLCTSFRESYSHLCHEVQHIFCTTEPLCTCP